MTLRFVWRDCFCGCGDSSKTGFIIFLKPAPRCEELRSALTSLTN